LGRTGENHSCAQNAVLGIQDHLLHHLVRSIAKADRMRFIVAFLMESGVRLIGPALKDAARRGAQIQILTSRYLSITEPSAIYYLLNMLEDSVDIRIFSESGRSFHPKAYIFDYKDAPEASEVYVGSSNVSASALRGGVEWNYRLERRTSPQEFERFSSEFDRLFHHNATELTEEWLRDYAISWRQNELVREESRVQISTRGTVRSPQPRGAQIEALYYLRQAREEGVDKGLVIAATGVGKTYLAAFDSQEYRRVLFVAHREEILRQAEEAFRDVRPKATIGYYSGHRRDNNCDVCLATVQTLARQGHLSRFAHDHFDYVVIDEFHHAAADSYVALLNHFRPRFFLGLTATPYRTDNRDIYDLCDNNVIYEMGLKEAIGRGLLVPFHYYGVYDEEVDYDTVDIKNGTYVIEDLERELSRAERAELVLEKYRSMAGSRTLGFCVSIRHAEYMAEFFSRRGVASVAVHSGAAGSSYVADRSEALRLLERGKIRVIFAIDIFNEGVDIPALDTVMFLRPTESYTIFLQQLGRGLRLHEGKKHLLVLDFIGNYKRAHYIPVLLSGKNPGSMGGWTSAVSGSIEYPPGCLVQFDFRLLDLFEEMAKRDPLKQRKRDDFYRLRDTLGRRPWRYDVYEGSDIPMRHYLRNGWLCFLQSVDSLTDEEESWLGSPAEEFLKELEKTSMTKSYKVPTIDSFIAADGSMSLTVPLTQVGERFQNFYVTSKVHQQDLTDKSNRDWSTWTLKQFTSLVKRNPIRFLSRGEFFHFDEINQVFSLDSSLEPYAGPTLASHIKDILKYRVTNYFAKRYRDPEGSDEDNEEAEAALRHGRRSRKG
jgi:superfamily II DNA or RNA helicase/HKD family nuclease